jgi:hypothetical protein
LSPGQRPEDSCYLYIWPDGESWYTQPLHFQPGRNIGSVSIGLEKESRSGESSNLSMTVTIARDKKALRPIFERIVPLPKIWGHRPAPAGRGA